jgi:hypothetical protein
MHQPSKLKTYRKISIAWPGGIHFFSTHNFWTTCHRRIIKAYSEWKVFILSEYGFIFVLLFMIQKLCVAKKVDTPWSIYRDFTVYHLLKRKLKSNSYEQKNSCRCSFLEVLLFNQVISFWNLYHLVTF